MGHNFLVSIFFSLLFLSSGAMANKTLMFADFKKGFGYKIEGNQLIAISGRYDVSNKLRWYRAETLFHGKVPTIKKIGATTYEAEMNTGVLYSHIDDAFGRVFYYHGVFQVLENGKTILESSKFQSFSLGSEDAPNFDVWKQQIQFKDYKSYTLIQE